TQGTPLTLTCPRGTGLTASVSGNGSGNTITWTMAVGGAGANNATLGGLVTLTPSTANQTGNGDTCVALSIATTTLPAGTYHGSLQLSGTGGSTTVFYFFRFTVTTTPTSTSLASNNNPSVFGQSVSFTATISPSPGGVGTVTFKDGTVTLCTQSVTGNTSTCSTSLLGAGSHPITASFSGTGFGPNTDGSLTQTVNKAPSTTAVTCPPGPYTYTGSPQTPCSATVTGAGGLSGSVPVTYTNNTNAG